MIETKLPVKEIEWTNKVCYIEVTTDQSDNGRWGYGFVCQFWVHRANISVPYIDSLNKGYSSENEAVCAALDDIGEYCQWMIDYISPGGNDEEEREDEDDDNLRPVGISKLPKIKEAMTQIKFYKESFTHPQLELF